MRTEGLCLSSCNSLPQMWACQHVEFRGVLAAGATADRASRRALSLRLAPGWMNSFIYGLTDIDSTCWRRYSGLYFIPVRRPSMPLNGCIFAMRTLVLMDGQNLYHLARQSWGGSSGSPYNWPSYDVEKLAQALVDRIHGRILSEIRFYTGVPHPDAGHEARHWYGFWSNKLNFLRSRGVYVYQGRINPAGREKGVDTSLALDMIQATYEQRYEVAIIVSQDHDFGPAVQMARDIGRNQNRFLVYESAFPFAPERSGRQSRRGIPGTTWVRIDKDTYDSCLDLTDYRPMP